MATERVAGIEALLERAKGAHGVYEQTELNGVYDQEWPEWYAQFCVTNEIGALIGRQTSVEAVTRVLNSSWEEFQRTDPKPPSWAAFTARRLVEELSGREEAG